MFGLFHPRSVFCCCCFSSWFQLPVAVPDVLIWNTKSTLLVMTCSELELPHSELWMPWVSINTLKGLGVPGDFHFINFRTCLCLGGWKKNKVLHMQASNEARRQAGESVKSVCAQHNHRPVPRKMTTENRPWRKWWTERNHRRGRDLFSVYVKMMGDVRVIQDLRYN